MYWNPIFVYEFIIQSWLNSNIRCIEMREGHWEHLRTKGWIVTLDVLKFLGAYGCGVFGQVE